jgi:hypothetical protein
MESAGLTRALILPWLTKTRFGSFKLFICYLSTDLYFYSEVYWEAGWLSRSGLYSPSYVYYVIGVSIFHRMNAAKHSSRNEK